MTTLTGVSVPAQGEGWYGWGTAADGTIRTLESNVAGLSASSGISVGTTNVDASSHGDDIAAAIAALPTNGGRVWLNKPIYTLTTGISTTKPNLEIVGTGNPGQDNTVGEGATQIRVPSGQWGFTFNPSAASSVFQGPVLRRLHFADSSGSGAALGGVRLLRTNNHILEDVAFSEFGTGHPAFLSDGTGDCNAYGENRNVRINDCMLGAKHIETNGLRYIGGFFQSQTTPAGSIALQHISGDTLRMIGTVFQNYDILVDLVGGAAHALLECRFEVFLTYALRIASLDAAVRGGTINNYLSGSVGTGIRLVNGNAGGIFDLDEIAATATPFSDGRTAPLQDYRLMYPAEDGYPATAVNILPAQMGIKFGQDATNAAVSRVANGITLDGNPSDTGTGTHVAQVGGTSGAGRVMDFVKYGAGAQDPTIALWSGSNQGPLIGTDDAFGTMVVDHSFASASRMSLRVAGTEALALGSGNKLGFFGLATPIVKPTGTSANATDLATAITLVNNLKAKLVALGLIA